eukprot:6657410-Alexandrium_andersonii.AAC.1
MNRGSDLLEGAPVLLCTGGWRRPGGWNSWPEVPGSQAALAITKQRVHIQVGALLHSACSLQIGYGCC